MGVIYKDDNYVDEETDAIIVPKTLEEQFSLARQVEYSLFTQLHFGKHKGLSMRKVLKQDPGYIGWMIAKGFNVAKKVVDGLAKLQRQLGPLDNFRVYSGVSFVRGGMVDSSEIGFDHLRNHLNNKHFDHAFDEEDMDQTHL